MDIIKEEALLRLRMLKELHGLSGDTYESYVACEEIYASGKFNVYGKLELGCVSAILLRLGKKPLLNFVKEFESKHNGCKVYHVIVGEYYINLLYIGKNKENWGYERPDKYNVEAYVINLIRPEFSERGRIAISSDKGVLIRTE